MADPEEEGLRIGKLNSCKKFDLEKLKKLLSDHKFDILIVKISQALNESDKPIDIEGYTYLESAYESSKEDKAHVSSKPNLRNGTGRLGEASSSTDNTYVCIFIRGWNTSDDKVRFEFHESTTFQQVKPKVEILGVRIVKPLKLDLVVLHCGDLVPASSSSSSDKIDIPIALCSFMKFRERKFNAMLISFPELDSSNVGAKLMMWPVTSSSDHFDGWYADANCSSVKLESCKTDDLVADFCTLLPEYDFRFKASSGPELEGLRVGMWNINRVFNKIDLLEAVICKHQFDICVVVESWLNVGNPIKFGEIKGYHSLRADRKDGIGGGILIYVRDGNADGDITHEVYDGETHSQEDTETHVQLITLRINKPIELDLVAVYSPPDNASTLCKMLRKSSPFGTKRGYKMWLGDMNIDLSSRNASATNLRSALKVKQIIKQYTRVEFGTATLIDHIFTDIPEAQIAESGVIRTTFSDHDIVYCTIKIDDGLLKTKMFSINHFSEELVKKISERNANLENTIESIHDVTKNLCESSYSALSVILGPDIYLKTEAVESLSTDTWPDARKKWMKATLFKDENEKFSRTGYVELSKVICGVMVVPGEKDIVIIGATGVSEECVKTSLHIQVARLAAGMGLWSKIKEFQKKHCSSEIVERLYPIFSHMLESLKKDNRQLHENVKLSPRSWTKWLLFSTFEFILAAKISHWLKLKPMSKEDTLKSFKQFVNEPSSVVAAWIFRFEHVAWDLKISPKPVCNAESLKTYIDFRKEDTRMPESNYLLATALSAQVQEMVKTVKGKKLLSTLQLFQCENQVCVCLKFKTTTVTRSEDIVPQYLVRDTESILYKLNEMSSSGDACRSKQHLLFNYPHQISGKIDQWNKHLEIQGPLPTVDFLGVTFDPKLTFKAYAQSKKVMVLKAIQQIRQVSEGMDTCIEAMSRPFVLMLKEIHPGSDIDYHTKPRPTPYTCTAKQCYEGFETEDEQSSHENDKHFVCPLCDRIHKPKDTVECGNCETTNPRL